MFNRWWSKLSCTKGGDSSEEPVAGKDLAGHWFFTTVATFRTYLGIEFDDRIQRSDIFNLRGFFTRMLLCIESRHVLRTPYSADQKGRESTMTLKKLIDLALIMSCLDKIRMYGCMAAKLQSKYPTPSSRPAAHPHPP